MINISEVQKIRRDFIDWIQKKNIASEKNILILLSLGLSLVSLVAFVYYYNNGWSLLYNDARSHLNIGRRVVEGLSPGFAQMGSIWLPLPHFLMVLTVWHDFMWHSGLAGAIWSMLAFVVSGVVIYKLLAEMTVGIFGRIAGVLIFVFNLNILYLQSLAMTEMILIATSLLGCYYFLLWLKRDSLFFLILSAFWIMLASLTRYDGWFLFLFAVMLLLVYSFKKWGHKKTEGVFFLFCTLGGFGIFLWLLWNLLIFSDPLYFMFGENSAHGQQEQLALGGELSTKNNLFFSFQVYMYALFYNVGFFTALFGFVGAVFLWLDKKINAKIKLVSLLLFSTLLFNIIALYLGHSVIYVKDFYGETWFNIRYGIFMLPSFAIFIAFLLDRAKKSRLVLVSFLLFVAFFSFKSGDAVTIEDALIGMSRKDVSQESSWLKNNTDVNEGYILISAAANDAIIFSSGLPMKNFVHEGAGNFYDQALNNPSQLVKWVVVRNDGAHDILINDFVEKNMLEKYEFKEGYKFADIYELKSEFLKDLTVE